MAIDRLSAESTRSATSNEERVRVDASKKRLIDRLAAQGRHLLDRPVQDLLQRRRRCRGWSGCPAARGSRCRAGVDAGSSPPLPPRARAGGRPPRLRSPGAPCLASRPAPCGRASRRASGGARPRPSRPPRCSQHLDGLVARGDERAADVVGPDGQLAVAAVDEHGQLDARGSAEVDQLVERGADRAAGEEDVVDEHHGAAVDREEDVGALGDGLRGQAREVVPVERDVEGADRGLAPGRLARSGAPGAARGARRGCACRRGRAASRQGGARGSRARSG